MNLKLRFPRRGEALIKIEEVQTIVYIIVLIGTMIYGSVAMDAKFDELEKRETAKYRTGAPPDKVDGVILIDTPDNSVADLRVDWKAWIHDVRNVTNRTEVYIVTSSDLGWYPIGPLFLKTNCTEGKFNLCRFEKGLRGILTTFPNFKWVLKVDPKTYVNPYALNSFLENLPKGYSRTRLLKSSIKTVGKTSGLDWKAGLFMSRRIVFEWLDKFETFSDLVKSSNGNIEAATGPFIQSTFNINPKIIADARFIPYSKRAEDFEDLIDYSLIDPCPQTFRYFGLINESIHLIRNAVTWHLDTDSEDRRGSMIQLPRSSSYNGYLISTNNLTLCSIERKRRKKNSSKNSL